MLLDNNNEQGGRRRQWKQAFYFDLDFVCFFRFLVVRWWTSESALSILKINSKLRVLEI
jgi:hypothetical protein